MSTFSQPPQELGQDTRQRPSGPYLPTIVSGLVVLMVTGLLAVATLTDIEVDLSLALPIGMVAAGALLIVGALVAVVGGRRRNGSA
jgi:hypothetical protein